MNKRPLQVVTAGLGFIPVVTGAVAMLGVDDPLYFARSHSKRADADHTDPLFSRSGQMRSPVIGVLALALALSGELAAQGRPPSAGPVVTVGAEAVILPEYPGSDRYRVLPFPTAQVAVGSHSSYLAPSTTGNGIALGTYALRTPRLSLAGEVGVQDSRPASRTDALAGTDDRDRVATVGASLGYRAGPAEAGIGVSRGLNDAAGFLGAARLAFTRPFGRLIATAGVGATFADGRQMRREFGVTELEASRRQALITDGDDRLDPDEGLAYRPDGGLRHVGASLSLMYAVSRRWSLIGFGGVDRLSDEAADSPLVRRREQFMGGLGLGFRI